MYILPVMGEPLTWETAKIVLSFFSLFSLFSLPSPLLSLLSSNSSVSLSLYLSLYIYLYISLSLSLSHSLSLSLSLLSLYIWHVIKKYQTPIFTSGSLSGIVQYTFMHMMLHRGAWLQSHKSTSVDRYANIYLDFQHKGCSKNRSH